MEPIVRRVVKQTLLSRRPARHSDRAAFATIAFLFATSVVYWENFLGLAPYLPAIPERVFGAREYWRVFTAMFIHSGFEHFAGNAFSIGLLAYLLYGYFGWMVFPLLAIPAGAATNALSLLTYDDQTRLLGASGVVYWMAGFWLVLYLFVDTRFGRMNRFVRSLGFALVMLVPSTIEPSVSYRTHGIGFALGALCGLVYFLANRSRLAQEEVAEFE